MGHDAITLKEFEETIEKVLVAKVNKNSRVIYKNKKATKAELNKKYKLIPKGTAFVLTTPTD